jgi:hypothetical protein
MNPRKFLKWAEDYERLSKLELKRYWKENKNTYPTMPLNFDKELLQQYIAYNNYRQTRNLVIATWGLAGVSIILSGITLYFQFVK